MPPKPDVRLDVKIVPRSTQNRLEFIGQTEIRAWVSAPPVEGAANEALIALVSKELRLPKSQVSIEFGKSGRRKRLLVKGIEIEDLRNHS